jgi:hypothetical protein
MELVKNFDFVQIEEEDESDGDSKEEIIANLTQAFKEMKEIKEGKLKALTLTEFWDGI